MEYNNEKPLRFGEVLDLTFRVIKEHFSKLFLIVLLLTGPLYLLQALAMYLSGTPFVSFSNNESWYQTFINQFEGTGELPVNAYGSFELILLISAMLLLSIVALPIAEAAILLTIDHIRKDEKFTLGGTIKRALSRYWALLGGSALYFLIVFSFLLFYIFGATIFIGLIAGVIGIISEAFLSSTLGIVIIGILSGIILIGLLIPILYLTVRWSFYFPPIVFEKVSPGLSKSWQLTRKSFWRLLGLFIVISVIVFIITIIFQLIFQLLLGTSVLTNLLNNILTIFTTMISFVAYSIVYFDLRLRNDTSELKSMIQSYDPVNSPTNEETLPEENE